MDCLHRLFLQTYTKKDEIRPLTLFLTLGILNHDKYLLWRKGDLETLDDAIMASSRTLRLLTNKMRRLAFQMDCDHNICRYVKLGTQEKLTCSNRRWLNQILTKSFMPKTWQDKTIETESIRSSLNNNQKAKATVDEWLNKQAREYHD